MKIYRSLSLVAVSMAAMLLQPTMAYAEKGYANFKPSQRQITEMRSPAYRRCMVEAGGVTASMNECTGGEYLRLDGRLNRSYQAKIARLSRPAVQRLRSDQRGWLATRDEACLNDLRQEREDGGTIYSILLGDCRLQELQRRILWIETRR